MKHLFFTLTFALTALVFSACSSSSSGGGNDPLPSPETSFPDVSSLQGVTQPQSASFSHEIRYIVSNEEVGRYVDKVTDEYAGITCSVYSGEYYCSGSNITIGEKQYSQINIRSDIDDGECEIIITLVSDEVPATSSFSELSAVSGILSRNSIFYSFIFSNSTEAGNYKDAYLEILIADGFEEDSDDDGTYYGKEIGDSWAEASVSQSSAQLEIRTRIYY